MYVLGLSCYYHDSAACLLDGERVVAAAEEERFTREKHDSGFPVNAVDYCLDEAGIGVDEVDYVGFYEKPIEKFDRILETFLTVAPFGYRAFIEGMPLWVRKRLWMRGDIRSKLGYDGPVLFGGHHESHAASAFFASPFREAAILTIDGVGEWNTTTRGVGEGSSVHVLDVIDFPHSLGLLYSAFTYYLGFQVNNGEYKVMGLSSYGEPVYADRINEELLDRREDGSFRLNMAYFEYLRRTRMVGSDFEELLGFPRREPDTDLRDHHFDIAASIQRVTEEVVLNLATSLHERTGKANLCMAGGVALNSVANGRVLEETPFEDVFVQPAAGDDGGAYGVATNVYHTVTEGDRRVPIDRRQAMQACYLGPSYGETEVLAAIDSSDVSVRLHDDTEQLLRETASLIADGNVVGFYQGRMEWGPRALGNRSILANPRDPNMQDVVNRKIKFREGFRPFAPSVLAERATEYFDSPRESPYMLFVFDVHEDRRDEIPAVTHVDGTARIQTVYREDNPNYYDLIEAFGDVTGTPVVLNTSLNRRGEPIVNTPEDAVACLIGTDMDYLCFPDANVVVHD